MSTLDHHSLAAFCSANAQHKSFASSREHIEGDIEHILTSFSVSEEVRRDVYNALQNRPPFDEGFRYEKGEGKDRVAVYVSLTIPQVHKDLEQLIIHTKKKEEEIITGAWVLSD